MYTILFYRTSKSYEGDASFLVGPSAKTTKLWEVCKQSLLKEKRKQRMFGGRYRSDLQYHRFWTWLYPKRKRNYCWSSNRRTIKRSMKPFGGIKLVESAVAERGLKVSDQGGCYIFNYAKNHNQAVFDAYDSEIKTYRSKHVLTGLP